MPAKQNTWVKEYFTFSKKERRAVILLALLAVFFGVIPNLFPFFVKDEAQIIIDTAAQAQLVAMKLNDALKNQIQAEEEQPQDLYQPKEDFYKTSANASSSETFVFNPNTATAAEWKRLGLRDKTIQTILNYRNKGGKFKKPEDISRIYGLSEKDYSRLLPFVRIEPENNSNNEDRSEPSVAINSSMSVYAKKEVRSTPVDINAADTSEWKSLKGIGSYYAKRIVVYREKLGGFYKEEQIAEVPGLPDSVFTAIKPFLLNNAPSVKQININTATVEELKVHPYIKYTFANAIVQYRIQHGNFNAVTDIRKIMAIDEAAYKKMAPYLSVK